MEFSVSYGILLYELFFFFFPQSKRGRGATGGWRAGEEDGEDEEGRGISVLLLRIHAIRCANQKKHKELIQLRGGVLRGGLGV
jgi:hypothetical protein